MRAAALGPATGDGAGVVAGVAGAEIPADESTTAGDDEDCPAEPPSRPGDFFAASDEEQAETMLAASRMQKRADTAIEVRGSAAI